MQLKSLLKTNVLIIIAMLAISFTAFSQAPNLLNYQGVARNTVGNPLPNQTMKLRLSIHDLLPSGAVVFSEIRQITTNLGGLFSVQIGSAGASSSTGTIAGVNWIVGNKFLQVELDAASNNNYLDIGTVQLVSVPYAFGAGSAATVKTNANLTGVVTSVGNQTSIANGTITSDMIGTINQTKVGLGSVNNTSDIAKPISTLTQAALDLKSNVSDVKSLLENKVDKVVGKNLSTNDYTTAEKEKLAAITGTNTGDQDLSLYATTTSVALKENQSNKSTDALLGGTNASDVLFPTQKAVKDYIAANVSSGGVADGGITNIKIANLAVTDSKITDVAASKITGTLGVSQGGTGATNAVDARTNLGLVIGTNILAPNATITGATKTKITYDAKGLVTAGADATTADIAASTNKNYVTDVQAGVISNTSGINTGDQTITLTGDVSGSGTGTFASTLANTAVAAGNYGSSSAIPTFTVDSKGRLTAAGTVGVNAGVSSLNYTSATSYVSGGTISGTSLTLSAADGTNPGIISTGTQTIAGEKTFSNNITAPSFIGNLSGNAATATTAGNITATTNATLTSLASLNTVGTITSGTISLTTNIATSGTLIAGTVTYPNTHGNSGQVLTSLGSGTLSWTTTAVFLPTVVIGTQQWMRENLDVMTYRDGTIIPQVTDQTAWVALTTGAWCYYNDPLNGAIYGKLYNWYAVNDSRGLAPQGWHIPTHAEWRTLGTLLGGGASTSSYNGGDLVAGGKMKTTGTTRWITPNTSATNESGYAGLPGGNRYYNGTFLEVGKAGYWWSATAASPQTAWFRSLDTDNSSLSSGHALNESGHSVRCLRD